jgi:hypothetical protein
VDPTNGNFGENELAALNAKADALSVLDESNWEEAIDWGTHDFGALCPEVRYPRPMSDFN